MFCYDELDDDKIFEWETTFLKMMKGNRLKTIKISGTEIFLKDESDIFQIADGFWSSVINKDEKKYWSSL